MGVTLAIAKWVAKRAAKYAGIHPRDPALASLWGMGTESTAGATVTERTALNCSTVWAAVNVIAGTIAVLPHIPYKRMGDKGDGREPAEGHPAYRLLVEEPNPRMTPFAFAETLTTHALTWGNGYALIDSPGDAGGRPVALWPITPDRVQPKLKEERDGYELDGGPEWVPAEKMLHVHGLGFDGRRGYGVVDMAREAIGLAAAAESFGGSFFGRGATPSGVIRHPGELGPKAKANLREGWQQIHGGLSGAHRVAILDEDMDYKAIGLPPEAAQFLQTRQFQVVEIARWFNLPPHLLRDLTHATYSNIEQQGLDFLIYTLLPWLTRWQQECKRKLFTPAERRQYVLDHSVGALLKADTAARYAAYNVGRNGGWLTLNDILRAENLDTMDTPEGDERLMPANMLVIGKQAPAPTGDAPDDTAPVLDGAPAADVQATALNGAQVLAMVDITVKVANGELPASAGKALLTAAFPAVSEAQVNAIISGLDGFTPAFPGQQGDEP